MQCATILAHRKGISHLDRAVHFFGDHVALDKEAWLRDGRQRDGTGSSCLIHEPFEAEPLDDADLRHVFVQRYFSIGRDFDFNQPTINFQLDGCSLSNGRLSGMAACILATWSNGSGKP